MKQLSWVVPLPVASSETRRERVRDDQRGNESLQKPAPQPRPPFPAFRAGGLRCESVRHRPRGSLRGIRHATARQAAVPPTPTTPAMLCLCVNVLVSCVRLHWSYVLCVSSLAWLTSRRSELWAFAMLCVNGLVSCGRLHWLCCAYAVLSV